MKLQNLLVQEFWTKQFIEVSEWNGDYSIQGGRVGHCCPICGDGFVTSTLEQKARSAHSACISEVVKKITRH